VFPDTPPPVNLSVVRKLIPLAINWLIGRLVLYETPLVLAAPVFSESKLGAFTALDPLAVIVSTKLICKFAFDHINDC
jgi:hypothetical protein